MDISGFSHQYDNDIVFANFEKVWLANLPSKHLAVQSEQ